MTDRVTPLLPRLRALARAHTETAESADRLVELALLLALARIDEVRAEGVAAWLTRAITELARQNRSIH